MWADHDTTECAESKECHGPKHHYDECVERVTGQIENDGKASEDCVEECKQPNPDAHDNESSHAPVFHLAHCASALLPSSLLSSSKPLDTNSDRPAHPTCILTRPNTDSTRLR
jgi:hypothetical protein